MDVDMMKSSATTTEDHMDMISMMMQMEKLPEFFEPFHTAPVFSEFQFSNGCNDDPNTNAPNLIRTTAQYPIMGNPVEDLPMTTLPLQSNSTKFKYSTHFSNPNTSYSDKRNSMAAMREMIFHIAAMQPIHIDPESVKPPKRRNVKISKDPQSVAARHRRERISERIRILQRLVPGGTKMDTASMLDEAIHYVKFLKKQVQSLEQAAVTRPPAMGVGVGVGVGFSSGATIGNMGFPSSGIKGCQPAAAPHVAGGNMQMLR